MGNQQNTHLMHMNILSFVEIVCYTLLTIDSFFSAKLIKQAIFNLKNVSFLLLTMVNNFNSKNSPAQKIFLEVNLIDKKQMHIT